MSQEHKTINIGVKTPIIFDFVKKPLHEVKIKIGRMVYIDVKLSDTVCPHPPGAVISALRVPQRFPMKIDSVRAFWLLYGRAGCLTALFGGCRPGQ